MDALELQARLDDYRKKREIVSAALDRALGVGEVSNYNFQDSDGSQQLSRRSPAELQEILRGIEAQIDYYAQKLNGRGGVTVVTTERIP
jgi:hypothetical protein